MCSIKLLARMTIGTIHIVKTFVQMFAQKKVAHSLGKHFREISKWKIVEKLI